MNDIELKADIKVIVDKFYGEVRTHNLLAKVFGSKTAENDWAQHLERMYDFWNTVLFGQAEYKGNPFSKHVTLPISDGHCDQWVKTLCTVIDKNFEGPKADEVKWRAEKMGELFKIKSKAIQIKAYRKEYRVKYLSLTEVKKPSLLQIPNQKEKYSLTYIDSYGDHHDISFSPREYKHLMELIWDRVIEDWGDCKGRSWCGTCHIKVNQMKQALPEYDAEENHCLSHQSNREPASRLACQLLLTKDLDRAKVTYLGDT